MSVEGYEDCEKTSAIINDESLYEVCDLVGNGSRENKLLMTHAWLL
jgi:hypothetical protein